MDCRIAVGRQVMNGKKRAVIWEREEAEPRGGKVDDGDKDNTWSTEAGRQMWMTISAHHARKGQKLIQH